MAEKFEEQRCPFETPNNRCPIAQSNTDKNQANCLLLVQCFMERKKNPEVIFVDFINGMKEKGVQTIR